MKKRLALLSLCFLITACGKETVDKIGVERYSGFDKNNAADLADEITVIDDNSRENADLHKDTEKEYGLSGNETSADINESEAAGDVENNSPVFVTVTPGLVPAVSLSEKSGPVLMDSEPLPIYTPTPVRNINEAETEPVFIASPTPVTQAMHNSGTQIKNEPTKAALIVPTKASINAPTEVPAPVPTITKTASLGNKDIVVTPAAVPFPTVVIRNEAPFDTSPRKDPDKTPPRFINFSTKVTHPLGYAFDIKDYCVYADDRDSVVDTSIEGVIDVYTEGVYPVKFVLKDDAGNVSKLSVSVTVSASAPKPKEKVDKVIDYTEVTSIKKSDKPVPVPAGRETFSDFAKKYKTANTFVGIDVSKYQGSIDFEKVAAAGCEFVMIRVGGFTKGYTREYYFKDPYFRINIKNAKAAGLKVGIYWLSEEYNVGMMKESIEHLMEYLDGESLDLPIAFDWEMINHIHEYGMSIKDLNDCFEVFCDLVEAHGYEPCLYSSKYYLNQAWENVRNHRVWLANYTDKTEYQGDYFMWQHTDKGRIDGIYADVDFNVLYAE